MKAIFFHSPLLAALLIAAPVNAQVPMLLSYQGNLADPGGVPKTGMFSMQFSVYDAETAGNQLPSGTPWSETQSVTVTDGVFNVLLGSVTALPATLFQGGPSDPSGQLRFLQVVVDGEALTPRRRIVSAAYAIGLNNGGTSAAPPYVPGTREEASAMSEVSIRIGEDENLPWTKVKEISPLPRGGTVRVAWRGLNFGDNACMIRGASEIQLYRNDNPLGPVHAMQETSQYQAYEELHELAAGDRVQVYVRYVPEGSVRVCTFTLAGKELRITVANPTVPVELQ